MADDAPQLARGGADGLEQPIKADVIGDRDLKHIVDDEVAGKADEQSQGSHRQQGGQIQVFRELSPGIAPVDAGVD